MGLYPLLFLLLPFSSGAFAKALPIDSLKLPPGYHVELYADRLSGARQLALGTNGTVFVGTKEQSVYAIQKTESPRIYTIATGLNHPNGVAFRNGSLYVAEIHRILRFDDIENKLDHPPQPVVIKADLPKDSWHGFRYIGFGYDDKLYIGIGAPCNVCIPSRPEFATIMRMNPDGSNYEVFTKGVRNTVGFDWDPTTQQLWFTDNGRDNLGDDIPPDKLNHAPNKNMHFGFPYWHGKGIPDPEYGSRYPESAFTMPTYELPAHVAALGMKFYRGAMFPPPQQNPKIKQVFIAEHGSWNRSTKVGYQVIRAWINGDHVLRTEPFLTGFLQDQTAWGRPVDVLVLKDGSLLISDDTANVIYRVTYK